MEMETKAEIPIVCVSGCPVRPDNFMETRSPETYRVPELNSNTVTL
jgi:hypothetical protein